MDVMCHPPKSIDSRVVYNDTFSLPHSRDSPKSTFWP